MFSNPIFANWHLGERCLMFLYFIPHRFDNHRHKPESDGHILYYTGIVIKVDLKFNPVTILLPLHHTPECHPITSA